MKKLLALLLAGGMLMASVGCGNKEEAPNDANNDAEATNAKFVLGLDDSFPPMGFRDDNNEIVGFDIDLANAVCEEMGMELELKPIDWSTKEFELNSGKIDCIWNGFTYREELTDVYAFSSPYLANNQIIAVKTDSDFKAKEDLVGKNIGVQSGSTAEDALKSDEVLGDNCNPKGYAENITALQDLKLGRVDAVIIDEVVARYYTTSNPEVTVLDGSLAEEVYVVGFKKGNDELLNKFQEAFSKVATSEKGVEIGEKWFGADVILKPEA